MSAVAVVGTGQTDHAHRRRDVSLPGLVREAIDRALADAEATAADVDAVVLGTAPDFFEGVAQPEQWLAATVGAVGKPLVRVHTAGSVGGSTAIAAASHVASGLFDTVLAVAFEKLSETDPLWGLSPKQTTGRLFGAGAGAFFAPYIRLYQERYGAPAEIGPQVVVKARRNAADNPHAHLRDPVTVEEVMASPVLWDPLRRLECCPTSDGAAAMVFTAEPAGRPAAWVRGASAMAEAVMFPGRDGIDPAVGRACAQKVYAQAGIADPLRELDVAEIYEPFSWIEPMWYENLGFCEPGGGWKLLERGDTDRGGAIIVNPSGGVMCTNPIGASGLVRMLEVADRVRSGEAGLGLGHAYGGASSTMAMMVFGGERP